MIVGMTHDWSPEKATELKDWIRRQGSELGFSALSFAAPDLADAEARLAGWLAEGMHGEMDYMATHGRKRSHPAELVEGTRSILSVRVDYLTARPQGIETNPNAAVVARYAWGRDYHKSVRHRLQKLAQRIEDHIGPFQYRAFSDSAPVMEVELAQRSGLGWRGKHTLLLSRSGSWFFLGELFTDLPLPPDPPNPGHCGHCRACIDLCPTGAILAPYVLDARRCIAYLTIELPGSIPEPLRPLIGNRIYGCDDCQIVCPWNRHAHSGGWQDFLPRNQLDQATLVDLMHWELSDFNDRLAGSPIRRIGHARWLRNLAVGIGNGSPTQASFAVLRRWHTHPDPMVREHVNWAIDRLEQPPARVGSSETD